MCAVESVSSTRVFFGRVFQVNEEGLRGASSAQEPRNNGVHVFQETIGVGFHFIGSP